MVKRRGAERLFRHPELAKDPAQLAIPAAWPAHPLDTRAANGAPPRRVRCAKQSSVARVGSGERHLHLIVASTVPLQMLPFRLTAADAARYSRIRERMLHDAPWAFDATTEDDPLLQMQNLKGVLADEQTAIFAIKGPSETECGIAPDLVAVASITRARQPQYAHRSRIWGVYVDPEHRSRGLGGAVLRAAIARAREWHGVEYVDIALSTNSPAARQLYVSCGFVEWGREPEATAYRGYRFDEIYMALRL